MELPVRCGSKLEVCAVVRFFAVRGEKLVKIYRLIRKMYGDECLVITISFANQTVNLNQFFPPHGKKTNDCENGYLGPAKHW